MVRIPLAQVGAARRLFVLGFAGAWMVAATFLGATIMGLPGSRPGIPTSGAAALVLSGFGVGVTAVAATGLAMRAVLPRRSCIWLTPAEVIVDHPAVLAAPLRIPRSSLSDVLVDEDAETRDWLQARPRFALDEGWLWSVDGTGASPRARSPLPLVSSAPMAPNVALRFALPLLPGRPISATAWGYRVLEGRTAIHDTLLTGDPVRGLLLRVEDPAAARTAFDRWWHTPPAPLPAPLTTAPPVAAAVTPTAG